MILHCEYFVVLQSLRSAEWGLRALFCFVLSLIECFQQPDQCQSLCWGLDKVRLESSR